MDCVTDHTYSNQSEQQADTDSGPSNRKLPSTVQGIQPELMAVSHITERLDSLIQLLGNGLFVQAIQPSQISFTNKGKNRPPVDGENSAHAKRPTSKVQSGDSHNDPGGASSHQENVSDYDHSDRVSIKAPSDK